MEYADPSTPLREQMAGDEHLLWNGQPKGGISLHSSDIVMIPFSLMWGGFAFFWEWTVITSEGAPFFFVLWGVPFVLVGIYLIVGRFFWDAYRRARTYYGVSNQRIVIVTKGVAATVKSLPLRTLSDITLATKRDGSGSIQFGAAASGPAAWFAGSGWPGARAGLPAFELIEHAKSVYDIVRQAQQEAG